MPGRLIVVEGLDGSGKSTLARGLAERLGATLLATPGAGVLSVRQAVDTCWKESPIALQLFYAASVVAASDTARGLMAAGRDVVVDRYWASTVVYAEGRADGLSLSVVEAALCRATLTLWVEVPEAVRTARLSGRGRLTEADTATLVAGEAERLRTAYARELHGAVHGRVVVLDGGSAVQSVVGDALGALCEGGRVDLPGGDAIAT